MTAAKAVKASGDRGDSAPTSSSPERLDQAAERVVTRAGRRRRHDPRQLDLFDNERMSDDEET